MSVELRKLITEEKRVKKIRGGRQKEKKKRNE